MPEFFLEIGTEEIPSGFIEPALKHLKKELDGFFEKSHVQADACQVMGTPRRLVIFSKNVEARQKDVTETYLGPNIKVAFDEQGKPTQAAKGFARGKGVDVAELTTESTPKGKVQTADQLIRFFELGRWLIGPGAVQDRIGGFPAEG